MTVKYIYLWRPSFAATAKMLIKLLTVSLYDTLYHMLVIYAAIQRFFLSGRTKMETFSGTMLGLDTRYMLGITELSPQTCLSLTSGVLIFTTIIDKPYK